MGADGPAGKGIINLISWTCPCLNEEESGSFWYVNQNCGHYRSCHRFFNSKSVFPAASSTFLDKVWCWGPCVQLHLLRTLLFQSEAWEAFHLEPAAAHTWSHVVFPLKWLLWESRDCGYLFNLSKQVREKQSYLNLGFSHVQKSVLSSRY